MYTEVLGCETGCFDGSNTLIDDEIKPRGEKLWSSKVVPGVIDCNAGHRPPPMLKSMARGKIIQLKRCMENGLCVLKAEVVQSSSHFLITSDGEYRPCFEDCDGNEGVGKEEDVGACRECSRMAYACKEDKLDNVDMLSCGNHRYIRCF